MPNIITLIGHLCQARYRHTEQANNMIVRPNLEIDPFKTFYLVNPDNTLKATEDAILPLFKSKLNWEGLTGNKSVKSLDAIKELTSKDMIMWVAYIDWFEIFFDFSVLIIIDLILIIIIIDLILIIIIDDYYWFNIDNYYWFNIEF